MAESINSMLADHEKLVQCPFNKAHLVVKHRMANHIIKCSRTHSSAGTQECRFNVSHIFLINEISAHEKICPDRVNVEMSIMQEAANARLEEQADSGISSMKSNIVHAAIDDENWDLADPVPTYNPLKTVRALEIVRHIQHGTPSLRKQLREQEYERIMKIKEASSSPSSSNFM